MSSPFALFTLFSEMFSQPQVQVKKDEIAVVYVDGTIIPGYSQSGLFGAGSGAYSGDIRKALETAAKNDAVKAVVMRVNSPGGSAEASEVILNAARQVQAAKPFVVSMGDVAGSGGYYISCAADVIYADASTVTASIGVVGGKLVTQDMWNKLGITWTEYQRGAHADIFTSARPFDNDERALFQHYMDQIYDVFKGHVSKGRGYRLRKPIEEIAGGRVYTGRQALRLGLVDYVGGLSDAIACAAEKASLEDYEVRVIPEPKDFLTVLMGQYSGQDERPTDIRLNLPLHFLADQPNGQALFKLMQTIEPQRAKALLQALRRIELIRQEGVIMMMPVDLVLN
jgi:protease-4